MFKRVICIVALIWLAAGCGESSTETQEQDSADSGRGIKVDFDAVVMKHTGHYPMLERPDEFNRHVRKIVLELSPQTKDR